MLFEQGRTLLLPILQGLDGGDVAQCTLGDGVIIESSITKDRVFEALGGIEAIGHQDLADAAIETLDHAVGLGVSGLDETMIDAMESASPVKGVCAAWPAFAGRTEAIGKLLAVVGQDACDGERSGFDQAFQEALGRGGGFVPEEFDVHPARGPVDGSEQILAFGLIGHLGQVLHIDIDEARLVVLERLGSQPLVLFFGQQGLEIRDAVPAQAAVEARPRHGRMDEFSRDDEQIVEGQKQGLAQRHDDPLLGGREGRVQGMGPMGAVFGGLPLAPLAHRRTVEIVLLSELALAELRCAQLVSDGRCGAGVLVQIHVH
jgi:hypothetical protein